VSWFFTSQARSSRSASDSCSLGSRTTCTPQSECSCVFGPFERHRVHATVHFVSKPGGLGPCSVPQTTPTTAAATDSVPKLTEHTTTHAPHRPSCSRNIFFCTWSIIVGLGLVGILFIPKRAPTAVSWMLGELGGYGHADGAGFSP